MTPTELIRLECIGSAMRLLAKPFHLMCGAGNLVLLDVGAIFDRGVRE